MDFLIPLLLSFWCVERSRTSSDSRPTTPCTTSAPTCPPGSARRGRARSSVGMRVYVDALVAVPEADDVRLNAAITRVSRDGEVYLVDHADGVRHEFDHSSSRRTRSRRSNWSSSIPELETTAATAASLRVLRHDDRDPRRPAADASERVGVVGGQRTMGWCAQLALDLGSGAGASDLQELGHVRRRLPGAALRTRALSARQDRRRTTSMHSGGWSSCRVSTACGWRGSTPTMPIRTRARSGRRSPSPNASPPPHRVSAC